MSQDFFFTRLGQWVFRTDPIDDEPRKFFLSKPSDPSKEYNYVRYYHSLQEVGVKFAPILNVHSSADVCLSCEG